MPRPTAASVFTHPLSRALAGALTFALLMLALPGLASAQSVLYNDPPEVRFFIGGGATYGGDKLASATYDNGRRQNVRAGNMAQVFIGLEWQPTRYFQAALSGGYHTDSAGSYNGDIRSNCSPTTAPTASGALAAACAWPSVPI